MPLYVGISGHSFNHRFFKALLILLVTSMGHSLVWAKCNLGLIITMLLRDIVYTNTKWSNREEEQTFSRGNKKHDDFYECPKAIVGT